MLAGVFTEGALSQLKSLGFSVAYFPYNAVIEAFKVVNIDARFDERTPDAEFAAKMNQWNLSASEKVRVCEALVALNKSELDNFMETLQGSVERKIKSIRVFPLHGIAVEWPSLDEALDFIKRYDEGATNAKLVKYEVHVRFVNGDKIVGEFGARAEALDFLGSFR